MSEKGPFNRPEKFKIRNVTSLLAQALSSQETIIVGNPFSQKQVLACLKHLLWQKQI